MGKITIKLCFEIDDMVYEVGSRYFFSTRDKQPNIESIESGVSRGSAKSICVDYVGSVFPFKGRLKILYGLYQLFICQRGAK